MALKKDKQDQHILDPTKWKKKSPKLTNSEICSETTIDKIELNQEPKQTHNKWGD